MQVPHTAATQPTRSKPRKIRVKEGKSNSHERFVKQNMRMIVLSAVVSLAFACSLTFLFVYMAPAVLNFLQDGILDVMAYLRGPGDKSMITAAEVDSGIPQKWLPITMNLTREDFYSTYYQKEIVVFPGHVLDKESARKEALKLAGRGARKKVTIHDFVSGKEKDPSSKSLNEYRKMRPWTNKDRTNIYMDENSQLLAKAISGDRGSGIDLSGTPRSNLVTLDLGGDFKFTTVLNGTGPPFRQGRHRLYEVLEGTTQWLFFHPNALPTVGYSEVDHYTSWMKDVYPSVSPLFSPLQLTLRPGYVLYIPEGYYYTYTAETAMASMILQEASMEDAGTELYCLGEGAKRMSAGDYMGAVKLFNMGLDLPDESDNGQGRHSHLLLMSLGRVHEEMGSLESAETAYRDAISQNSRHTPAYFRYMTVIMRDYEEKKHEAATKIVESTSSHSSHAALDARARASRSSKSKDQGSAAGASPECITPAFVDARNEARQKFRNAAALAETSGVLTEALSQMNSTMVLKVNTDKEVACGAAKVKKNMEL